MSIPPVTKNVRFVDEPRPDDRNPRPLYRTESEQFNALYTRFLKVKDRVKEDPKIKEIALKKLVEFAMAHPEYRDLLPKELR